MSIEMPWESTPARSVSTMTSAVVRTILSSIPQAASTAVICARTRSTGTFIGDDIASAAVEPVRRREEQVLPGGGFFLDAADLVHELRERHHVDRGRRILDVGV